MIDFEIPPETRALREKVRTFVHEYCIPAEKELENDAADYKSIVARLQQEARSQRLWCPFISEEYGGMGLGHLANALVQMELGESMFGAVALNCQGPDDATMLTLLEHGTDYQKEKYLKPLLAGGLRICFSMTERASGADATGMQTTAVLDGDNYVLNGEKWFSTGAASADMAVIMAKTDPDAPRHQQFSTFIVELPNPGYQIQRNIETLSDGTSPRRHLRDKLPPGGHSEVLIKDLVVPRENVLGGIGGGFNMGQHRLAYGRLRHGMHNIALAQRALDLAAAHVTQRETFGERLADRQGVQWMLAECATELYKARLVLLHLAYKAEKGQDIRHENSMAKVFLAHMVHKVVDTALQLHGALGYSLDTPLANWYATVRRQRIVDGPDEVHKWRVGRQVIRTFEKHGTTALAAGGELL